ncbi:MAG: hypothetical protein ACK4NP_06510 [Parvularculaceae bacterium]
MKPGALSAAMVALFAAAGCKPGELFVHDEPIVGPYRLRAAASAAELHICYERKNGACDLRVPGRVFAIGFDDDFVAAAVHPLGDQSKKAFYYVVRDFDGPSADVMRAVRGPFENEDFVEEMKKHGVAAPDVVVPRR